MRDKRTKRVVVRFSEEEHRAVSAKAAAAGVSVSELVRDHLDRVRVYNKRDTETWLRAAASLRNSAVFISEVATVSKPVDAVVVVTALASVQRLLRELGEQFPSHDRQVL